MTRVPSRRTQVGIIGAGPAGLVLAQMLWLRGINSVVLEARSRDYVERRIRAGLLEDGTVQRLTEIGVADRLLRLGLVHHGFAFRFDGRDHRIPLSELTGGRRMTIYGQEDLTRDLIRARLETDLPLLFEAPAVGVGDVDGDQPVIYYEYEGTRHELRCDVVAGCDGFHGVSRDAVRPTVYAREYPVAWFGVLAQVRPTVDEIVYARHERGFALHSVRSPELSRLHLQCRPDEDPARWSDVRIWDELDARLATDDGSPLARGPILRTDVIPLRSVVSEPMRQGRLFLAGDAAHIVPPTGAKGLNLAVADVDVLADALLHWYRSSDESLLEAYSATCLRRVWQVERFSWWMTWMLHRFPDHSDFDRKLQRAELEHVCSSYAAARALAETYAGMAPKTTGTPVPALV